MQVKRNIANNINSTYLFSNSFVEAFHNKSSYKTTDVEYQRTFCNAGLQTKDKCSSTLTVQILIATLQMVVEQ